MTVPFPVAFVSIFVEFKSTFFSYTLSSPTFTVSFFSFTVVPPATFLSSAFVSYPQVIDFKLIIIFAVFVSESLFTTSVTSVP